MIDTEQRPDTGTGPHPARQIAILKEQLITESGPDSLLHGHGQQDDPLIELARTRLGAVLRAPVTKVIPFGVFVEIGDWIEGWCISRSSRLVSCLPRVTNRWSGSLTSTWIVTGPALSVPDRQGFALRSVIEADHRTGPSARCEADNWRPLVPDASDRQRLRPRCRAQGRRRTRTAFRVVAGQRRGQ